MSDVAQSFHKPQTKEVVTSPAFGFVHISTGRELRDMLHSLEDGGNFHKEIRAMKK